MTPAGAASPRRSIRLSIATAGCWVRSGSRR